MSLSIRLGCAFVASVLWLPAAASERWLHLHVEEGGPDGTSVRIQLPLALIRAALPHLRADGLDRGRVRLRSGVVDPDDLTRARTAITSAMAGEVVELGEPDRPLRLERQGDWLVLRGTESGRRNLRLQVPAKIARDVFDGLPEGIDLLSVLDSIGDAGDLEIARIETEDTSVRIWIDAAASPE